MVETDDDEVVRAKIDTIGESFCGPEDLLDPDHRCDPPWFIVSSPMSKKKAKRWRKLPIAKRGRYAQPHVFLLDQVTGSLAI
jgi:hypothetical protein